LSRNYPSKEAALAKNQYTFEKRRREIEKRRKNEEKRQRKLDKQSPSPDANVQTPAVEGDSQAEPKSRERGVPIADCGFRIAD